MGRLPLGDRPGSGLHLVVTGGGTGGHVFPAVEVALAARADGAEVRYFGSLRGQESAACEAAGLPFRGFPSEPVVGLRSLRGLRSLASLMRARGQAKRALVGTRPDRVFSTGGYASAPVVLAARALRIPYVIHEQNSVPGRTNRILARHAKAVATVFRSGAEHFGGLSVVRTGMPIRRVLRKFAAASPAPTVPPLVLAFGGSQGAAALNEVLPQAVWAASSEWRWLHACGPSHYEHLSRSEARTEAYDLRPHLDAEQMAAALGECSVAVCRSGAGTLAELAAYRRPSVLIPYPYAFGDHQRHNALEFEDLGAAKRIDQPDLSAVRLIEEIEAWLSDSDRRDRAARALAEWDIPDATQRILRLLD